jgi:hypothetical protein
MKILPFQATEMAVHNPRMKFATLLGLHFQEKQSFTGYLFFVTK